RAHYFRGLALHARQRNLEARAQFREAIALAPGFPDSYLSLLTLATTRDPEDKLKSLADTYVRLTGNKPMADYVLSGAYRARHDYRAAARCAETAVQQQPDSYAYAHNLGQIYLYARRAPEAERALLRAL